ncbi:E3 ubiquitin-protein ligase MARCH3-like [Copidosoma floridanum]|uniref:E3 ubiquitin-protein ligase MARCH3-like n=1 Tax=Copidosoma floridanum TaxID=29053 RepID=UPI0006C957F6|nr:E3 ubiquitin-protein ligase MARCH3-like [Copidosoma floridanum]
MSLNEEQLQQHEGDEIQQIGYDIFPDASAAPNDNRRNQDKENGNLYPSREKTAMDAKKKTRGTGPYICAGDRVDKIEFSRIFLVVRAEDVNATSSSSSSYDICRICHMGNPRSHRACNLQNMTVSEQDARRTVHRGSSSANLDLGLLVSACRCRGTVGLVHTKCLERWLTESGHTHCELCGYKYATIRVPRHGLLRSFFIWIKTFVATRQMLLDSLYLVVTTPLAVFSAYVCAMTLKMALENRIGEIPWTIVAMLPTCSLTLVAYWGWLLTLQRLHGRRWRQYWQSNFIVQLVPHDPNDINRNIIEEFNANEEDVYDDLPDLFNLM